MDTKGNKEEDFQKGFNEGYLLAKHNFFLADKIADALKDTERGAGFKEGCKEFNKEKEKPKINLPTWLKGIKPKTPDKGMTKTKGHDKDYIDKG